MPADIRKTAQEAVELREKATQGEWRVGVCERPVHDGRRRICRLSPARDVHAPDLGHDPMCANADLIAHAGTHYGEIARALVEVLADLPHALGRCGCVPEERLANHGTLGSGTIFRMPAAHDAAIERLEARVR